MIIYRDQRRPARTSDLLRAIQDAVARGDVMDALIEFGSLESGVADALCLQRDEIRKKLEVCRRTAVLLGGAFYDTTAGKTVARAPLCQALDKLAHIDLPGSIEISVPEGYAYYALYPENYIRATHEWFQDSRPEKVVVIGIRSIGTSLSAVVAAVLEQIGVEIRSFTVRPRGHPFDRRLALGGAFQDELQKLKEWHFAIVDEGPGLSGSSFAGAAQAIAGLGVPDERIVLFSGWHPAPHEFNNARAAARWARHRVYAAGFDQAEILRCKDAVDLSAGMWRPVVYSDYSQSPAVQPRHERRKYLESLNGEARLWKFAGLGRHGSRVLERSSVLGEAGWAPRAHGLENGFLVSEFVPGRPLSPNDANPKLLELMSEYLIFIAQHFRSDRSTPFDELRGMIELNISEGLGEEWASRVSLETFRRLSSETPATALDGRMLPHEWVACAQGFLKTDAVDHHTDHFFPGCQDIAWDVAGTCVEFGFDGSVREDWVDRFARDDAYIRARLPFYFLAYLSYRLGYAQLAAQSLPEGCDRTKFASLASRYAAQLRREILHANQQ